MKTPILYSFKRCPYAMRARMALKLANIKCELREITLNNKPDHMLEASPKGTVPVLILEDKIIDESIEIINWVISLEDIFNRTISKNEMTLTESLIRDFDREFKYHLDRYKYETRYKGVNKEEHKYKARDLLVNLNNSLEEKEWLNGDKISISDISILPFIRQYRIADIKWFDEKLDLPNINRWLDNFLNSKILNNVMTKYKIWEITDPKVFL